MPGDVKPAQRSGRARRHPPRHVGQVDAAFPRLNPDHSRRSDRRNCAPRDELSAGFSALTSWISTVQRPAGDDILNPTAVASPFFGCRFTDPTPADHPEFKGLPCPQGSH